MAYILRFMSPIVSVEKVLAFEWPYFRWGAYFETTRYFLLTVEITVLVHTVYHFIHLYTLTFLLFCM